MIPMGFEPNITTVKGLCPDHLDDGTMFGAWDRYRTCILWFFRPTLRPLKLPKHIWWAGLDLNQRSPKTADLQSAAFDQTLPPTHIGDAKEN